MLQELFQKARSLLNKLTPEKFDKLVSKVQDLPIDSSDRLKGVIDLIFEKVRHRSLAADTFRQRRHIDRNSLLL